ncbi:MAG TPA: lipid-A-disaccharide synthase [Candidatus Gastranaerophilaceae bacterium]|nr:lipid-A-disaccharide synthase [Candidatus Gastranaerophilaceae bacterium]HPT41103.1 lipid-A-disaccharide synthase [Candidatus Gastranaerophilaceae bacterium]
MTKKIFIITGEHSGDIHASKVVDELKKIYPDVIIEGVGGENLKNAGVKLFSTHEKMSVMGISLKILINHLNLGKNIINYLKNEFKPDLVLLVDYGAFNLNIAKVLKKTKLNCKIFYYVPPQIWASRKWRINVIKKNVDKVLCIFPFEKPMYDEYKIENHYCGHPLTMELPPKADREEFFEKHELDKNKKLVSIFPGSRIFELENLMKTFVKSAKILQNKHPELQILISQAPNLSDEVFKKHLKNTDFKVIKGENHAMLSVSDALVLASGTVALEAALYETPMIIAYKGPWLLYLIYLLVRCLDKVSLPNIISNKLVVPEILQEKLSAENICYNIEKLLYDKKSREEQIEHLKEVKLLLSDKNSPYEAALEIKSALM